MGFIAPETDADAVYELVHFYFNGSRVSTGTSQKEIARAEGHQLGTWDGIARGIAAFLSVNRRALYPYLVETYHIEAVNSWDVTKVLNQYYDRYLEAFKTDLHEVKKQLLAEVVNAVMELVNEPNLAEENETRRRDMIRAGQLAPSSHDREWMTLEAADAKALAATAEARLKSLDVSPIVKDTVTYLTKTSGVTEIDVK